MLARGMHARLIAAPELITAPEPMISSALTMRPLFAGAATLLSSGILVVAGASCSPSSGGNGSSGASVSCGPGTRLSGSTCVVASDASVEADANRGDAVAPDGSDDVEAATGPSFAGLAALAPASTTSLLAAWQAATDASTTAGQMRYRVYLAPHGTAIDYAKPTATTAAGATSFELTKLSSGQSYDVAVRALDAAGQSDDNTVVHTASPAADTKAPKFGGATAATPAGPGAVMLTWSAASDDLTPAAAIVYYVFVSDPTGQYDFAMPTATSAPGATSLTVPYLYDPSETYRFIVRARDAAGNLDANTTAVTSPAGPDKEPPVFSGCQTAIADSAGSAALTWQQATDDATPTPLIAYDVFASTAEGKFDFTKPALSVTGASGAEITGLQFATTYYFVCRARDYSKNEDGNLVELSTRTLADSQPPTFAGLTGAQVDGHARTVQFTWNPASDAVTPQSAIVYDVYQAQASGAEDFAQAPLVSSPPGATGLLVTDLTPETTLYWVVRARNQAGVHDANTVEANGTILVSFSRQLQVTFSTYCAVSGCHVPGNPTGGLALAPGFAYQNLVNVPSREYPTDMRVNPGDPSHSYLYLKVSENPPPVGWQMPAPATGSVLTAAEKQRISDWISQGAVNN